MSTGGATFLIILERLFEYWNNSIYIEPIKNILSKTHCLKRTNCCNYFVWHSNICSPNIETSYGHLRKYTLPKYMKSSYCFISKIPSERCIWNSIYALCSTNSLGSYCMDKNGFWRNDLKSNSTINNWRQSEFFRSWYCSFAQNICYKVMSKKNNTIIR